MTKFEQCRHDLKALYLLDEGDEQDSKLTGVPDDLLEELIQDNAYQEAWALFYDSVVTGQANVKDCNTMLKACYDTTQMRHLIEVTMKKAGVMPNVITYNTLIGRLMVEGSKEEALEAVEEFMPTEETYAPVVDLLNEDKSNGKQGSRGEGSEDEQGIVLEVPLPGRFLPNDRTKEALALSGMRLSRFRTSLLQQLLQQGRNGATYAAWVLFDKLVNCGEADVYQFNVMLKACEHSQQLRKMIDITMRDAGVKPTLASYTTLIHQLMMEGRETEATLVVEQDMLPKGISPDEKVQRLLDSTSVDLRLMRNAARVGKTDQRPNISNKLRQLISTGKLHIARRKFEDRVEAGEAHVKECNEIMGSICHDSIQMRNLFKTMLNKAEVKPNLILMFI